MKQIYLIIIGLFFNFWLFSQHQEKNAHVSLKIQNEMGEIFNGPIRLITNKDTVLLTARWNNIFQIDLIPGRYRIILQNKLFADYLIDSFQISANESRELEILWKHRTIRLPEIRYPMCIQ